MTLRLDLWYTSNIRLAMGSAQVALHADLRARHSRNYLLIINVHIHAHDSPGVSDVFVIAAAFLT